MQRTRLLSAFLVGSLILLAPFAAAQATYTTGFEPPTFTLGNVTGQDGWGPLGNSPTGGTIVPVPPGSPAAMGTQSLQLYTAHAEFFPVANHLFSATIDPPAGETGSTAGGVVVPDPESHFSASLWFRTPTSPVISSRSDGRFAELNPSSKGSGAADPANRYAQVRLFNSPNTGAGAVRVEIGWYQSDAFVVAVVANLAWGEWYRFDYLLHLVDGLDGVEPNDRFTLTIFDRNGVRLGSACGSTWEAAWKSGDFGGGTTPRAVNGFDFWSTSGPNGTVAGHLDNLTFTAFTPADAFTVTVDGNANACAGGTTLLTADTTGGGAPISGYAWRNANDELVGTTSTLDAGPGTYTVTVTNELCETTTSNPFAVTASAPLAVSIDGASTVPFGQTTTLTADVTGGSGTIASYTWRDANANVVGTDPTLEAGGGTYTVTVTDATCGTATSPARTVAEAEIIPVPTASETVLALFMLALAAAAVVRLRV